MEHLTDPYPKEVHDLTILFRRIHDALNKHQKFLAKGKRIQVDWQAFGESLGNDFYAYVRDSGKATTLVNKPPKHLPSDGKWPTQDQPKIEDSAALFSKGIAQVRNNIEHAGKLLAEQSDEDRARSLDLIREALWALREAVERHPDATTIFSDLKKKVSDGL